MQKQGEIQKGTVRKDRGLKEKKNATEGKDKDTDGKQKEAVAGEVQFAHTVGRHGTDDEKDLNPEA